MYTIHVDGKLLFSTATVDEEHIILSPKLSLDVNGAGSLSFILPPGNVLYDSIRKLKSIITVHQDEELIFRGRVLDDVKDFYNQKDVYCEGDRSFLLDSQCAPYTYSGTVLGLFQKLIDEHNAQVDSEKQFTIGNVTAVTRETLEVENVAYWETLKEIDEKLLGAFGGYLMTRTEGGVTYVDWLAKSGETSSQVIEFSVNLLDIKDKVDASDVFTVLIPLGASEIGEDGEYQEPVNISSVNSGLKYIQDDEAVAKYGKIWRTRTWEYEKDPASLLAKGLEHLKTGIALQTLTLNAIDMHFMNGSAEAIRKGAYVRILSNPHGLDIAMNCTKLDIDLLNPESTIYTFGEPPRTLSENVVKAEEDLGELTGFGGGGRSVVKEMKDYIRWADIRANADEALIELLTGEVSKHGERLSKAEITLDGVNAQILLKASVSTVDALSNRVTSAEIEIDGLNSEIVLKASKIDLQGYVTANQLKTEFSNFESGISDDLYVSALSANAFECSSFSFKGNAMTLSDIAVMTNATLEVSSTGGTVTGVKLNKTTATIYYMDWR